MLDPLEIVDGVSTISGVIGAASSRAAKTGTSMSHARRGSGASASRVVMPRSAAAGFPPTRQPVQGAMPRGLSPTRPSAQAAASATAASSSDSAATSSPTASGSGVSLPASQFPNAIATLRRSPE